MQMSYDVVGSAGGAPTLQTGKESRCYRYLAAALLLAGPLMLTGEVQARDPGAGGCEAGPPATTGMTEYQVRQRVYGYLGKLGYSRAIGAGGASIQDLDPIAGGWLATVRLRVASAVQTRQTRLFVDARRGQVSEAGQQYEVYAVAP